MSVTQTQLEDFIIAELKTIDSEYYTLNEDSSNTIAEFVGYEYWGEKVLTPNLAIVQSWGGEGEGDSIGYVLKATMEDQDYYLKISAYYDSWNGTEWDNADNTMVKPVERMVTFYE